MAIVINADSKTVLILDGDDRIDSNTLSLLGAKSGARPATIAAPRDEFAAMRQVESEVYQIQS
jgi:hypothetical protein